MCSSPSAFSPRTAETPTAPHSEGGCRCRTAASGSPRGPRRTIPRVPRRHLNDKCVSKGRTPPERMQERFSNFKQFIS